MTNIGVYAFSCCLSLTSINIPDGVTNIGHAAFGGCRSLTSINIPSSVVNINGNPFSGWNGKLYNESKEFIYEHQVLFNKDRTTLIAYISNDTNCIIPDGVINIGDKAFYGCKSLNSINIPNSVTYIGDKAFYRCKSLNSINIPNSVTNIGNKAFSWCKSLTSINIPDSVTYIGNCAFNMCSELKKATFQGKLPSGTIICGLQSTCFFYVPKAYLQDYKDVLGSKYSYIFASKDSESGEQKPEQCAVPTISYADGKLTFASSTPNAEYHYTIADTDMASDTYSKDGIVKLSAAYNISAYATANGYMASDKVTATLYWVEANLQNNPTNINQTATRGIIVTSNDGIVTLSGLNNDETVRFYTVDGKQLGAAKAINGTASQAVSESIVIAQMGNQTIKIAVK